MKRSPLCAQVDVNLASPPQPSDCPVRPQDAFSSHFPNSPFTIDAFIAPADTTCPPPGVSAPNGVLKDAGLPGGCTHPHDTTSIIATIERRFGLRPLTARRGRPGTARRCSPCDGRDDRSASAPPGLGCGP